MDEWWDRFKKSWNISVYALIICFCFCAESGAFSTNGNPITVSETRNTLGSSLKDNSHLKFQNLEKIGIKGEFLMMGASRRLLLGGPGSSPPRCTAKCGRCTPCKPVHVPVPPGTPVTAEYYPEAWRCKCGNKLYMP